MKLYTPIALALAGAVLAGCGGSGSAHNPTVASRVIFSSDWDQGKPHAYTQVFSMSPDGSDVRQITDESGDCSEPAACDDGSKIVFTRRSWFGTDIYVMNEDGSDRLNLTHDPFHDNLAPCYCGDGAEIVFESDRSGDHQVWKMNADGANPTRLTGPGRSEDAGFIDEEESYSPDFSHDNEKIVYVRGENSEIWMMNSNGSNKVSLHQIGTTPRFNHVRSLIVFARDGEIFTMHTDGTHVKQLTGDRGELFFSDPAFSPDSRKITFTGRNDASEIYIMNFDGSGLQKLTSFGVQSLHPNFCREAH
jgi:TolB protein